MALSLSKGIISCDEFEFNFEFSETSKYVDIAHPEEWAYEVKNEDNETLEMYMLNQDDTNFFDEAYEYALASLSAKGKVPKGDIDNFHSVINAYLCGKFSSIKLKLEIYDENDNLIKQTSLFAPRKVDACYIRSDENEFIDIGMIAFNRIGKFLKEAKWQYTFDEYDSKHILWFGLEGESPIDCWSITGERIMEDRVIPFWFPDSGMIDWNEVCPDWNCAVETWMFVECGETEPEGMKKAIEDCPIKLDSEDTPEVLRNKFEAYFEEKRSS